VCVCACVCFRVCVCVCVCTFSLLLAQVVHSLQETRSVRVQCLCRQRDGRLEGQIGVLRRLLRLGLANLCGETVVLQWCYSGVCVCVMFKWCVVLTADNSGVTADTHTNTPAKRSSSCCFRCSPSAYSLCPAGTCVCACVCVCVCVCVCLSVCGTVSALSLTGVLLLPCCYIVVTLLSHCCYMVATLLLNCCYTVVTLLLPPWPSPAPPSPLLSCSSWPRTVLLSSPPPPPRPSSAPCPPVR
jgi:hypothetical protein